METVYEESYQGYEIKVYRDEDYELPNSWGDTELFLIARHRDFTVEPPLDSTFDSVVSDYAKTHWILGLEAYIHSGVALALSKEGSFPYRQWDVSQLGVVFVSKKDARTRKKARELALELIETWNDALSGSVYGYEVTFQDEVIDSCWGFYGDYERKGGLLDEAKGSIKCNRRMALDEFVHEGID